MSEIIYNPIECPTVEGCTLNTTITADCRAGSPGGNSFDIYLTNLCDVDYFNVNANDIVDSIVLRPGAFWYQIQGIRFQTGVTEEINAERGFITSSITFQLNQIALTTGTRQEGAALVRKFIREIKNPNGQFVAIVTSNSGVATVYGLNSLGLTIADGSGWDSGLAFDDPAAWTVVLSTVDSDQPYVFDGPITPLAP